MGGREMKRFKKMSTVLLLCMLVSMLAMPVSAKAAALNRKSITLNVGKSYKLKAKGIKRKITWTSSKKSVATVSKTGVVKARKKGTAVITAKYGKKKLTCKVTVKKPVKDTKFPQSYFKTVKVNASNISQYFTYVTIPRYDMWGERDGCYIMLKCKDPNWYLLTAKNYAAEFVFNIVYNDEDGTRATREAKLQISGAGSATDAYWTKEHTNVSITDKVCSRAQGTLVFVNKKAVKSIQYGPYDTYLKMKKFTYFEYNDKVAEYVHKKYSSFSIPSYTLQPFEPHK